MYKAKLTIKAIIRAEQLLQKPFYDIDQTSEEELSKLLYCIALCNSDKIFSYDAFLLVLENENQAKTLISEVEETNNISGQFISSTSENGSIDGASIYIKDIAGMLVLNGVDAHFVYNEMELSDIPVFIEALDKKKREEMEASRLWTYFSILPHVGSKTLPSPRDLFLFPFEVEEKEKELQRDEALFNQYMNKDWNKILKN